MKLYLGYSTGLIRFVAAAGLAAAFLLLIRPLVAEAQQDQEMEISLGSDLSVPGGDAFLSLTLLGKGAPVGKVTSEISFPPEVLSFVEAKRGESGDQAGAEIKTAVREAPGNPKTSVLQVVISGGKELPEGILATLKFKVSAAAPETDIKLLNVVKAVSLNGEEIPGVRGNEAILTISPAKLPSVGCFLFTH